MATDGSARVGVVGLAEINAGPSATGNQYVDINSPAFWSAVFAALSLVWLIYVFGRTR